MILFVGFSEKTERMNAMNKRNRNKLKIAAQLAVSVCAAALLAGSLSVSAAKLNDIDGHWSKEYV